MNNLSNDLIFYHIYPLGFCNAPKTNDFYSAPVDRLNLMYDWCDHLCDLGVNALYLGPVFESTSHGYDTADYFKVDRRLGTNESFANITSCLHQKGIKIILDGVFNHIGRDFWAFKDLMQNKENSRYKDWFSGVNFNCRSPYNDPFTYDTWNGHFNLVKLNLKNDEVKSHLFHAVSHWIDLFNIDGLRLDAADCLDFEFLIELAAYCRKIKPGFILIGEVIHGDYTSWANSNMLDSVTNYECYKGLFSSHNDNNFFEIAYSLNRQCGAHGIYKNLNLYTFVDNHDVNRIASSLTTAAHLYTVYLMLFTIPGVPSIYYGSEWGIKGEKNNGSDDPLRPWIDINYYKSHPLSKDLEKTIKRFIDIRKNNKSLREGEYRGLFTGHNLFAFLRETGDEKTIVIINSSKTVQSLELEWPVENEEFLDLLDNQKEYTVKNGKLYIEKIYPNWGNILSVN